MRSWSEEEFVTYTKRFTKFVENGLDAGEAEDLAEQMLTRDFEGVKFDDRRVCFECKKLTKDLKCPELVDHKKKPQPAPVFLLRRCDHFQLRGKK